jgi:hypothetical protein
MVDGMLVTALICRDNFKPLQPWLTKLPGQLHMSPKPPTLIPRTMFNMDVSGGDDQPAAVTQGVTQPAASTLPAAGVVAQATATACKTLLSTVHCYAHQQQSNQQPQSQLQTEVALLQLLLTWLASSRNVCCCSEQHHAAATGTQHLLVDPGLGCGGPVSQVLCSNKEHMRHVKVRNEEWLQHVQG